MMLTLPEKIVWIAMLAFCAYAITTALNGAEIKCEEKQIEAWDRKAKEYVVINQVDCGHMTYMYPAAAEPAWAYDPETGKKTMIWVVDEDVPDGN